jgi:hypothetical protein
MCVVPSFCTMHRLLHCILPPSQLALVNGQELERWSQG